MAEPGSNSNDRSLRETVEELFLAGVGVVALTKERSEELVDELVARGKVSRDDARPYEITEVRRQSDGQLNVFVREIIKP